MFGIYNLGKKAVEFQENNMGTNIFMRMTRVTTPEAKEFSLCLFVSKMSLWIWFTGKVDDEKFCNLQIRSILK